MFRFATPFAFFLFLPLLAATLWIYARRIRRGLLFAPTQRLPAARSTWRMRVAAMAPLLIVMGMALAIIALARPQTVLSRTQHHTDAIAIQMVVDISGSMNALDFATPENPYVTRLDVVKTMFAKFVERRADDMIGLVTFGGYAVSRVPLTIDHEALLHVLEGIDVPRHEINGREVVNVEELATAIGDGLATACARLKDDDIKSRIVVLLSDGESNAGVISPEQAVKIAHKMGIKVYTIGVGTTGTAPARITLDDGRTVVQRMSVRLDADTLRRIALQTGAQYFHVRDPEGLESAMAAIDELERTEIDREIYSEHTELFERALVPGLGLLCLGCLLNVTIRRRLV